MSKVNGAGERTWSHVLACSLGMRLLQSLYTFWMEYHLKRSCTWVPSQVHPPPSPSLSPAFKPIYIFT